MLTAAILLLLTALSGLFSGSEAALFSLNRAQIRQLEAREDRLSRILQRLLARPQALLNSLLVGNNLMNVAISTVVASYAISRFGAVGVELAILVGTALILLFGEILPKSIAVSFPAQVSRAAALPLYSFLQMLRPLTWVATSLSKGLLRLVREGEPASQRDRRVTPHELRAVLEEIDEDAGMSKLESRLVQNILYFPRTTAEEVMSPRVDITAAPVTAPFEELLELIRTTKHSRIPLYEKTVDAIVGYLPARDFLLAPTDHIGKVMRPVLIVPEKATIDRVFHEFRKGHWKLAVVVNEYGETVGILTQEDLIEEVVGELSDEYESVEEEIVGTGPGTYEVRGRASLQDLGTELEADLPLEQAVTVNGFLCSLYGGFPRKGTVLRWKDLEFEVLEATRHRVQRARVRRVENEARQ
ncbi:MAG: DUF21 domain-containing protein [Candidatus Eisenbacteria bacterium]|nr:DUF21 domain-containing protein [Candidatus Latescibacterota bacterium]MBD3301372.1 DUF21 domain-containing protein [Candidatus Eisenbacteria bacterium]